MPFKYSSQLSYTPDFTETVEAFFPYCCLLSSRISIFGRTPGVPLSPNRTDPPHPPRPLGSVAYKSLDLQQQREYSIKKIADEVGMRNKFQEGTYAMVKGTSGVTGRLYQLHELHFTLSEAGTPDEVCRLAVELGREPTGVDRIGIWFKAADNPEEFVGSYGIDETGRLRDERTSRIPRNPATYDDDFFSRKVPFRFFPTSPVFDNGNSRVGEADLVVAPLWHGSDSIGVLSADNFLSHRHMSEDDRHLVALLARMVAHLVTTKRTEATLRKKTAQLEKLATTDEMTGFLNRRTGIQNLEHHISIVRRHGGPLAVCFLDIDHLKTVNDEQGHNQGDLLIRTVADLLRAQLRAADIVCRMGGDEFMIVLPEETAADARQVMARLTEEARQCEKLTVITPGPWFSFGVAEYRGSENGGNDVGPVSDVARRLIHEADMEMYIYKRSMKRAETPLHNQPNSRGETQESPVVSDMANTGRGKDSGFKAAPASDQPPTA